MVVSGGHGAVAAYCKRRSVIKAVNGNECTLGVIRERKRRSGSAPASRTRGGEARGGGFKTRR